MMLRQWRKYHGDLEGYRNRAEERRRAFGSTAFVSPHRPAPSNAQSWPVPGFSLPSITIPGHPGAPPMRTKSLNATGVALKQAL